MLRKERKIELKDILIEETEKYEVTRKGGIP